MVDRLWSRFFRQGAKGDELVIDDELAIHFGDDKDATLRATNSRLEITGEVQLDAGDANGPTGAIPTLFLIQSTATGNQDLTLTRAMVVVDVWCVATNTGNASDTITVQNGASAITDAMDLNVADTTVVRPATIDDAQQTVTTTLRVANAGDANADVYILAYASAAA